MSFLQESFRSPLPLVATFGIDYHDKNYNDKYE
jgi:hypothetical protein